MGFRKTGLMLAAVLALGACQNGGIFGGGSGGGAGTDQTPGSGNIEESSLDYFNTTIGDTVLFTVNEATLGAVAKAKLDAQVQWLNRYPDRRITIEGHADEQGTREYNLALGARRAAAVRNYMVAAGLLETRLSIISYGKERPLAVCSTEACWSQNRRSVTVVAGGMGNV